MKPAGWRAAVWIGLIFLALAGPALDGCKPREPGPTQLRPAHPVAAALALGQTRDFVFTVPPGSLLHLAVEQRGIDVILHLHLPDGREWMVVDSPGGSWGTEEIFALAEVAGEYRLSVAPDESAHKSGSYSVALAPFHAPSPQEKDRVRASSALAEGDRLRRSGTAQNLKAALGPLQQALTISERLKNPRLQAITHYRMGQAYRDLRQRDAAYRHFDSARLLFLQMGDRIRVADLLRKIAQLQFQQGEVPQARDTAQQALHLFREDRKSDEAELANCLNDLALYEKNLGEIGKAVERYNEALRAYRKLGLIHEQVTVLNNLAKLYVGIGEIDQARTCIEDIHDLLARSGISDPAGEARGLVTLGGALEKAGDLKESERVLRRAVDLLRGAHELPTETAARLQLAKTLIAASRFDEARKLLEETRPLSRSIGDPVSEGQVLTNMAVVLAHDGKGGEALRLLDRALLYFRGMSDPDRTALTLIEKAKIQQQAGDLGGAVSTVREALEVEEGLRQNLERTLRVSLAADRRTHSDLLIDLLMDHFAQEGDSDLLDAAYEAQESSQARTVLEDLVESQQAAQREGLPESSQSQQIAQLLRNRTLEWQRLEGEDAEGDSGEDHRQEVVALEKSIQKLLEQQARAQAEQRAESVGPGQPWRSSLTLKEIQAEVLDPSKVLLSYHLGADRGFLWVVTSTSIEYHALPPSDEIDGLVRRARRYLEREQPWREREVLPVLRRLSEILIEPAGERLAGKKLLISPDGSLLRLPFSVLPSPGSAGTYRPLHQDHAIVMVPSASVQAGLRRLHKGRRPAPGVIAVLANPVFGPGDERLPDRPTASRGRSGLPWLPPFSFQRGPESNRRNQPGLPPLPYSEDEARAILALAPPGPRRLALGFDANVALVRGEQLRNYRYLHFATHALLHSQPDLSRLVLSQLDRQGREQEGVLLAYQISQLDLPVEMVVLSACETGRVEEKGNEEVSGLARAFLYAGARRVVASLWKVEDLPTAELMKHFYRALWQEGLPPAEALSQAQNKMRQTDWSEPSYWAGFVIVGED